MLKLKKVAVTGGLSSGKSTVCRFFRDLGAHVVSADEIVHQLLSPDTDLGQEVIGLLGTEIFVNGRIDRSSVAEIVFKNPRLLDQLEGLLHPAVSAEMKKQFLQIQENKKEVPLFVAEIPLLFEAGQDSWFDATIAVVAEDSTCLTRFMQATDYSEEEYYRRQQRQLGQEQKAEKAHFVLRNNGDLASLKLQVIKLFKHLTNS